MNFRSNYGQTAFEKQEKITSKIPAIYNETHGYHRSMYQQYTNISRIKSKLKSTAQETKSKSSSERNVMNNKLVVSPKDECIICEKKVKRHCRSYDSLIKLLSNSREKEIKLAAEKKNKCKNNFF